MSETNDLEYPWVEEFRPKKIEDVIGAEGLTSKFNEYIITKSIPHLMFVGNPGTGKTTCAKILATEICGAGNYLYINASDRNNIETIRTEVINYCSTAGFGEEIKIVILDEGDGLTSVSQRALRGVIEDYSKNSRFIITANYDNKIIDAIHSRCQKYDFVGANKADIAKRCYKILVTKNIKNIKEDAAKEDIKRLVIDFYPDIRSIINNLQKFTKDGVFKYISEVAKRDHEIKFIEYLKTGNIRGIREEIISDTIDYLAFYKMIYHKIEDITKDPTKKGSITITISDYQDKQLRSLIPEITFIACLIEIVNILKG